MNYTELLTNVRNYTEVDSNVLSNSVINVFLTNVENRVARELDLDEQRRYATTTLTANNSFVDLSGMPGTFRLTRGIQIITNNSTNARVWLEQRDTTFIDEYTGNRTTTGEPKYWANWDNDTLILSPTPDDTYTISVWYNEQPERLGDGTSNTTTTTFISNNAPEILIYGVVAESYSYLKNIQDMQLYDQKFQQAMSAFAQEQMGRKRRDEYSDGVLRLPLRSVDPGGS
jgi:hypothetical protein